MYWVILAVAVLTVQIADLKLGVLTRRWVAVGLLLISPHIVYICKGASLHMGEAAIPVIVFAIFFTVYFLGRLALYVTPCRVEVGLRVRVMMGGRRIFLTALLAGLLQIPVSVWLLSRPEGLVPRSYIIADVVVTYLILGLLLLNGAIRIMATSRRLGVVKRLVFLLTAWIPLVNLVVGVWFCKIVKQEFARAVQQTELSNARAGSAVCRTQYPLLLLHGVGFRDYKYLNYWGRIPALLIENGATLHYGHQQAWGSIEDNAREIKAKLEQIIAETGCEKVNIIAHSKGGLDARYLITRLEMAPRIASLTTISTPHRGSALVNVLCRLPENLYRRICELINAYFRKVGDTNPDAYRASRQLMPEFLERFNEETPDADGVYYQSFAAAMKAPTSDSLLLIPSAIMKWVSGDNDGLVTIDSAKWGRFRGTLKSTTHRGISHGDLIDLMHQDFEGFNIAEEYITIVSELKEMGY